MNERIVLPPDRMSPARARQWARPLLAAHVDDETDAVLCLSELVANAVLHAGTEVDVTLEARKGVVRIAVSDGAPSALPTPQERSQSAVTGRGLLLVDQLADRWGFESDDGSKTVWFEVVAAGAPSAPRRSPAGVPVAVPPGALALPAELDLASASSFRGRLEPSVAAGDDVVLDGSRLEFIDSTGVSLLVSTYERCQRAGSALRIVNASPALVRTLQTLALDDLLLRD